MRRHLLRHIVTLVLVVALFGCAAVDPYITNPRFPNLVSLSGEEGEQIEFAGGLQVAIQEAFRIRNEIYGNITQVTALDAAIKGIPIIASATALFLSLTQSNVNDLLIGLGIGSATVLGVDQFVRAPDRTPIYLRGAQAISCAVFDYAPYLVEKREYEAFKKARVDLAAQMIGSSSQISERAAVALKESAFVVDAIEKAGFFLLGSVQNVVDEVNRQLTAEQPSIDDIVVAINALPAAAKSFGSPGIAALAPAEAPAATSLKMAAANSAPSARTRPSAETNLATVEQFVERIGEVRQRLGVPAGCAAVAGGPLALTPSSGTLSAGETDGAVFSISGGKPPFTVQLAAPAGSGVVARQDGQNFGRMISISAGPSSPIGSYSLIVIDDKRQVVTATVTVGDARQTNATSREPVPGTGQQNTSTLASLRASDVQRLQASLCMNGDAVDGIVGPETLAALRHIPLVRATGDPYSLTKDNWDKLMAEGGCPSDRRNYTEKGLTAEALKAIVIGLETRLGREVINGDTDETNTITPAMRGAISEYNNQQRRVGDEITSEVLVELIP